MGGRELMVSLFVLMGRKSDLMPQQAIGKFPDGKRKDRKEEKKERGRTLSHSEVCSETAKPHNLMHILRR